MNRKTLLAFFLILLLVATAAPQPVQKKSQPAATAAPVSIPFELVTRHIVVEVMIDNSRPLSFVFDTGDKVAIVDSDLAKDLGLKLEGQIKVGGAGSDFFDRVFCEGIHLDAPRPGRIFSTGDARSTAAKTGSPVWS